MCPNASSFYKCLKCKSCCSAHQFVKHYSMKGCEATKSDVICANVGARSNSALGESAKLA